MGLYNPRQTWWRRSSADASTCSPVRTRTVILVSSYIVLLFAAGGQSTPFAFAQPATTPSPESTNTSTPPPPRQRVLTGFTTVLTYPRSFPEQMRAAAKWKNSTMAIVRNASVNGALQALLQREGVLRAWLGGYMVSSALAKQYFWRDGLPFSNATTNGTSSTSYLNWAPQRPSASVVSGAVALDAATGLWFDLEQGTALPAIVIVPPRDMSITPELPYYVLPPDDPPPLRTKSWQTGTIVVCSLLILPLTVGAIGVMVFHKYRPYQPLKYSGSERRLPFMTRAGVAKPTSAPQDDAPRGDRRQHDEGEEEVGRDERRRDEGGKEQRRRESVDSNDTDKVDGQLPKFGIPSSRDDSKGPTATDLLKFSPPEAVAATKLAFEGAGGDHRHGRPQRGSNQHRPSSDDEGDGRRDDVDGRSTPPLPPKGQSRRGSTTKTPPPSRDAAPKAVADPDDADDGEATGNEEEQGDQPPPIPRVEATAAPPRAPAQRPAPKVLSGPRVAGPAKSAVPSTSPRAKAPPVVSSLLAKKAPPAPLIPSKAPRKLPAARPVK